MYGEIFRGRRVDNGEWVKGWRVHDDIIREVDSGFGIRTKDMSTECMFMGYGIRVIPETIGRHVGLMDMFGQDIFEGDVVRLLVGDEVRNFEVAIKTVERETKDPSEFGQFTTISITGVVFKWYSCELFPCVNNNNGISDVAKMKIVGNKWENPELLEQEEIIEGESEINQMREKIQILIDQYKRSAQEWSDRCWENVDNATFHRVSIAHRDLYYEMAHDLEEILCD